MDVNEAEAAAQQRMAAAKAALDRVAGRFAQPKTDPVQPDAATPRSPCDGSQRPG